MKPRKQSVAPFAFIAFSLAAMLGLYLNIRGRMPKIFETALNALFGAPAGPVLAMLLMIFLAAGSYLFLREGVIQIRAGKPIGIAKVAAAVATIPVFVLLIIKLS